MLCVIIVWRMCYRLMVFVVSCGKGYDARTYTKEIVNAIVHLYFEILEKFCTDENNVCVLCGVLYDTLPS